MNIKISLLFQLLYYFSRPQVLFLILRPVSYGREQSLRVNLFLLFLGVSRDNNFR